MLIPVQTRAPLYFFPKNTPPKEIEEKLKKDRVLRIRIVSLAALLPGFILWYLTRTELRDLYQVVDTQLPMSVELAPIISIVLAGMMYYILSRINEQPLKYATFPANDGGIGASVIPDTHQEMKIVLTVFVTVGIIVGLYVFPILNITR